MNFSFAQIEPVWYALIGLTAITIIFGGLLLRQHFKIKRLLVGKQAKDLEDSIFFLIEKTKQLIQSQKHDREELRRLETKLQRSIRGVHTIRFNPFAGTGSGGNQSFSAALINEEGDGVVISSIYTRDRNNVYAKPVKKLTSTYELTEEEKQAIAEARNSIV